MTCPSCGSARVVIVVSQERRSFCTRCGTRWIDRHTEGPLEDLAPGRDALPGNPAS